MTEDVLTAGIQSDTINAPSFDSPHVVSPIFRDAEQIASQAERNQLRERRRQDIGMVARNLLTRKAGNLITDTDIVIAEAGTMLGQFEGEQREVVAIYLDGLQNNTDRLTEDGLDTLIEAVGKDAGMLTRSTMEGFINHLPDRFFVQTHMVEVNTNDTEEYISKRADNLRHAALSNIRLGEIVSSQQLMQVFSTIGINSQQIGEQIKLTKLRIENLPYQYNELKGMNDPRANANKMQLEQQRIEMEESRKILELTQTALGEDGSLQNNLDSAQNGTLPIEIARKVQDIFESSDEDTLLDRLQDLVGPIKPLTEEEKKLLLKTLRNKKNNHLGLILTILLSFIKEVGGQTTQILTPQQ